MELEKSLHFYILYVTKIDFPIDFNGIQDSRIQQVFAWV